jgi:protein-tyrosine phosphatase
MKKVTFVCHGNICRSPMAEYVMKHLVKQQGRENEFEITSGAVSREEIGNDIYPPAKRKLQEKGVEFARHRAHQITPQEFSANDLIITMDSSNMRLLGRIVPNWESAAPGENIPAGKIVGKVHMMMEFAAPDSALGKYGARDVADPWYTGDFEQTYQDVLQGCTGLLELLAE